MSREKQIEEMAKDISDVWLVSLDGDVRTLSEVLWSTDIENIAIELYNAGYRKQSEGEWETIPDYQPNKLIAYRHICSVCKTFYKDIRPHGHKYCHECGAKMKGGA